MALIQWVGLIIILGSLAALLWIAWRIKLRWWQSLVLRLVVVLMIALAFDAWLELDQPINIVPEILILDRSDSIADQSLFDSQVFAEVWKSLRPNRQVMIFGASPEHVLSEKWPEIPTNGSNLYLALVKAESALAGKSGRVVVATDGLIDDISLVDDWVTQFRLTGGQIDFILLSRVDYQSDLYVGQIKGSSSVWSGINFPIYLPVFSERGGEATLQVFVNGQLYREGNFKLQEGYITLPIMLRAGNPGVMQVEARVLFDGDQFPENNSAFASFRVYEQPRILVVTKNEGALDHFISAISEQNSEVVVIAPEMLPTSIEELESFQVIFVHDVLAQDFNFEQMQAIRLHVLELGKGLVFLGGRNSYTLGGYQNTALEPLMPIVLAPPDRVQRVPITFLLVLDRSGSMAGDRNTEISPIDLTREAAMRAIETLRSDDYLGVLTFSGTTQWDVDLRNVGEGLELRNAQDKVSQIVAIGGTFMYRALDEAVHELINTETTDYPHILLMSDGVSGDGSMDEFVQLVQNARENGITISTIALGQESDPETLARIAELGGGRFYVVNDPADLPTVMISESRAVQAENVQEGRTNMIMGVEDHPILAGFSLDELPLIYAYIAAQSKSSLGAEDVLVSGNFGDPLLSVWNVGLGRVAAWTGDVGEHWTPDMKGWEKQGELWQQVARYTFPDPSIGESEVNFEVDGMEMTVELALNRTEAGLAELNPKWVQIDRQKPSNAFVMTQRSSTLYRAEIPKPDIGAYTGVIQFTEGEDLKDLVVPFAVNYPDEWRFEDPEIGASSIENWVVDGGGSKLTFELELESSVNSQKKKDISRYDLGLILLILSWPIEIAVRRWRMPWRRA